MKGILIFFFGIVFLQAKINVAVSIEPQEFFVKKIGADLVETYVLVPKNKNPENYEPLLSQMMFLKNAEVYFGIGMEFEEKWKNRFLSANSKMQFFDLSLIDEEIKKKKEQGILSDQHVWLSVNFAKKQAYKIYEVFSALDSKNSKIYKRNLEKFLKEIDEINTGIKEIFATSEAKREFLVFHPAFEDFAREYNLKEWAIEAYNKETKIKHMQKIYEVIKEKKLKVIYIQPQFSTKQVELLAQQYKMRISTLDPFASNWGENLLEMARKIATEQ